jgi:chitin disaccharide deacetylase
MTGERRLIVNADDFGRSPGINTAVVDAHRDGIVTSASLMVRWPAAEQAVQSSRTLDMSIGLHVDLGEWRFDDGWRPVYEVVSLADAPAIESEVWAQLETFRRLAGRDPTHLDSHQHVHDDEPASSVFMRVAEEIGVPLRNHSPRVRYCGDFYGQSGKGISHREGISVARLVKILRALPSGTTELACHPGRDPELDSVYLREREWELNVLCDPSVRQAIASERIILCTFHDIVA